MSFQSMQSTFLNTNSVLFLHPENYRLQSAYENNLIIKMVFVSLT